MKTFNLPSQVHALLFDIDLTLYTNEVWAKEQIDIQIRHFAKLRGIPEAEAHELIARERIKRETETGKKTSLGNALTAFGIPISESIRWREELLEPEKYLEADPVLREALITLSRKYSLAAVTNNPSRPAGATLKALGVLDLFPVLVALDTTGVSKPHKKPYTTAAEALGVPCGACISIGDRYDIDIAVPLELGMGGILVDGVEDVYTLPDMLG
ncbi:MAG TPA: HAD family hydrolase [Treponemataceae bacterium]|nr:MAG: Flavin mononucleotide phosphatase YigB [Spirochaetes bacterium ADurb.Bin215]HPA10622.1 HAD family hydrolase [Treponemataceae bacterium]